MTEETIAARNGPPRDAIVGTTIGPYQIERQVGRGGMSTVYQARHIPLDRVVALKVLLSSLAGDQEFVDRFLAEARSAARLDYPHIVPVYDCGEIDGLNYIAMKLLEGRDLKRVLELRREAGLRGLPLDRAISFTSQAAGALEYAHQHRVVHRDVKPANIYVDENDRVTLVDFGIARAMDHSSSTLTGTVIGTPAYMSPEQAQGKQADHRSDIYSLGVVLYEMLTGAPPFAGEPQTVMHAHVYTLPTPIAAARGDIPQGVVEVVQRALAKNPEDRFPSAGALALALTNASGGQLSRQALEAGEEPEGDPTLALPVADPTGPVSGPHTPMAGGITHGTMAQPAEATGAADTKEAIDAGQRKPAAQRGPRAWLAVVAGVAAVAVALLLWLFLAGPLAGGDGRLRVDSDPPGAAVTVDGNAVGVTPLAAQPLSPGTHEVILKKASYLDAKQSERIRSRQTTPVRLSLVPQPASELLAVKLAVVGSNVTESGSTISFDRPVTSIGVEEPFGMVVTLAQKEPGGRDVTFRYEFGLFGPTGDRLQSGTPATGTVRRDDVTGQSFANTFTFHAAADAGTYQLKFFIDGQEAASRPITLTK